MRLRYAGGSYDRTQALVTGAVQPEGVALDYEVGAVNAIFRRMLTDLEFEASEMSASNFIIQLARGDTRLVAIPVFPSRTFRHSAVYIRTDRGIERPEDLKGRRVGVPEYQLTACVWARALLEDEFGVRPADITWVRGGIEDPGRPEKINLNLPPDVHLESAPADRSLSQLLASGDIDAMITPRPPSAFERGDPNIGWLFPDPIKAATEYFQRTRIFPIMHILGVRRDLVEKHGFLPSSILKAFTEAKDIAVRRLEDNSATKVTLPFVEEQVVRARSLMGRDYWSYGVDANRDLLETFLRHHHSQGLSKRKVEVDELFHPTTLESVKI